MDNRNEYDQAATVFSPDGRVYQVEYAREAIKRGGLAMALKFKDGIIFTIDKTMHSKLVEEDDLRKFYRITSSVGAAASGLIADARVLCDILRDISQDEYKRYGEWVDIKYLVNRISRICEIYTRYEGVRPFGTSLVIGGKDSTGYRLYETDPSGVYQERAATAIGTGSEIALPLLEERYKPEMEKGTAQVLICDILKKIISSRDPDEISDLEVHIITDEGFEMIDIDRDRLLKGSPGELCPARPGADDMDAFLGSIHGLSIDLKSALKERYSSRQSLADAKDSDLLRIKGMGPAILKRIRKAQEG